MSAFSSGPPQNKTERQFMVHQMKTTDQSSIRITKVSSDYWDPFSYWDHFPYWDETIKIGLIQHNIYMISRIGMV